MKAAAEFLAGKAAEITALQETMTHDSGKILALCDLLLTADPTNEQGATLGNYHDTITRIAGIIRDYCEKINEGLSDLEYLNRDLEGGAEE